jgi:hypothetical protein
MRNWKMEYLGRVRSTSEFISRCDPLRSKHYSFSIRRLCSNLIPRRKDYEESRDRFNLELIGCRRAKAKPTL